MKFKILPFIFLLSIPTLYAVCDPETKKEIMQLAREKPYELYNIIRKNFDSLNKILDSREEYSYNSFLIQLRDWNDWFECAHSYIRSLQSIKPEIKRVINRQLNELEEGRKLIKEMMEKLISYDVSSKDLVIFKKKVDPKLKKIEEILDYNFNIINQMKPTTNLKAEAIFPGHEGFFKRYRDYINKLKKHKPQGLGAKELFDRIDDFVKTQLPKRSEEAMTSFFDKLETLVYRLEEDKKKSWFGSSSIQKNIDGGKEILAVLRDRYPSIKKAQVMKKISSSKDAPNLILTAEALGVLTLLKKLLQLIKEAV
jgi:hypothetical protein